MLLRPEYLKSVESLALVAKQIVDSLHGGANNSRRNGTGQEFNQYRSYQPGDDIRLLDWKLYARSDRFFIREAALETNIEIDFILDSSASMLHEEEGLNKFQYAKFLIATLAWLAEKQGDQFGLFALNAEQITALNPKPGKQFFYRFLDVLLKLEAKSVFPKKQSLELMRTKKGQKKIIIFLTDMYQTKAEISKTIQALNLSFHEIILFHIMGKRELNLDYQSNASLVDLETGAIRQLGNAQVKQAYQLTLQEQLKAIKQNLLQQNVSYELLEMPAHPGLTLKSFLKRRAKLLSIWI